jgi:hypothetical protein
LAGEVITETYTEPQEVHVEEPQAKRSKKIGAKKTEEEEIRAALLNLQLALPHIKRCQR